MNIDFYKELSELIKKHKLTFITSTSGGLDSFTKTFEGQLLFITDGTTKDILKYDQVQSRISKLFEL